MRQLCVSLVFSVGAGSSLRGRARAEVRADSLVDVDEAEDVASSSSIRFRQSVSPSSISSSLSQIQLQQFSRVAEAEAGVVDSRVVMAAVVMGMVVGVECAGSARAQGTMSVFAHGWRRLQGG